MTRHMSTPNPMFGIGTTLKGNVATTRKLLDDLVASRLTPMGLTIGEADVLTLILIAPTESIRPKQLAEWLGLTTAGIAGRLNNLAQKALIERIPDVTDGRSVSVELTPHGSELAAAVMAIKDEAWSQPVLDALGSAKTEDLNKTLEKLNEALRSAADPT